MEILQIFGCLSFKFLKFWEVSHMNIQWYPGHMTKTRRQIEADLKYVDIVVEITDARIPVSSRNPDIDAICAGKPRLIVLNRADQADPSMTGLWTLLQRRGAQRTGNRRQVRLGRQPVFCGRARGAEGADRQVAGEGPSGSPSPGYGGRSTQRGQVYLYQ